MLDLRTDFSLPCKLIAEEHRLYKVPYTPVFTGADFVKSKNYSDQCLFDVPPDL